MLTSTFTYPLLAFLAVTEASAIPIIATLPKVTTINLPPSAGAKAVNKREPQTAPKVKSPPPGTGAPSTGGAVVGSGTSPSGGVVIAQAGATRRGVQPKPRSEAPVPATANLGSTDSAPVKRDADQSERTIALDLVTRQLVESGELERRIVAVNGALTALRNLGAGGAQNSDADDADE